MTTIREYLAKQAETYAAVADQNDPAALVAATRNWLQALTEVVCLAEVDCGLAGIAPLPTQLGECEIDR